MPNDKTIDRLQSSEARRHAPQVPVMTERLFSLDSMPPPMIL